MKDQIIRLLGQKDYVPANVPELLRLLELSPRRQQELQSVLEELDSSGQIARIKGNRYVIPIEADLIPGRIRMNRAGKGFLQPDDSSVAEIAVAESDTGTALHEDHVLVRLDTPRRDSRGVASPRTGKVVRILERSRTRIVGTLQQSRQFLYVIPDDPRMPHDVQVPPAKDVGRPARPGDKVVVELREWASRQAAPEGEIVEVLGAPDAEGVDMLSVIRQYNLPLHFPKAVLAEAHAIGATVHEHDAANRLDCRSHRVVTIDPDDAKDFDDAICLERVSAHQWRLWVHIADVSHYVKPGTALDTEARERGNSTYLVDRVIPMLPEALSNELCSLKPNVDRLTKCVEFLISDDGRVQDAKFHEAIIHSQRRFTYRQVLEILERAPGADPIEQMLHDANRLAQHIRRLRFKAGSLDLDFPETKIRLDEQGRILRIEKNVNDVSHQLIEEYMLLANEAVATHLMGKHTPAIYRIHEEPDEKRLAEYREDVLTHHVPCGNLKSPFEIQKLLQRLNTLPIGPALKIGFLKSLMRARYSVEPLGHYGLAKKKYTHFTSPIRRYADLVVHRALFDKKAATPGALREVADHISITERNSADAERDSKDVKLFAFLQAQLDSHEPLPYPALVTDVRNFGFFVDVPGLAMSGLVPLSLMDDDFYVFDESRQNLVGRRTRRIIRLGDRLTVQVGRVDTFKKQVDFCLVPPERKPSAAPSKSGRPFDARPQFSRPQPKRPQSESKWQDRPRPSDAPRRSAPSDSKRPQSQPKWDDQSQSRRQAPREDSRRPRPGQKPWQKSKSWQKSGSDSRSQSPSESRPDSRPGQSSGQPAKPQFTSSSKSQFSSSSNSMFKTSIRPIGSSGGSSRGGGGGGGRRRR
jgi:ribonuclease R